MTLQNGCIHFGRHSTLMSAHPQKKYAPPPRTPVELADEALMERIRVGDASALDALLKRYWDVVVAYARQILGDPAAAADTAQQTFIKLWQRREQWTPTGSVAAYVFRITRNAALNERRARRVRVVSSENPRTSATVATPWTPLQTLEEKELRAGLEAALRLLPERRKEVFMLARFQRLTYEEIAALMGISPQTVANQMSAALADLRRYLVAHL
jgi:RNA polymerase sigma-19 factor, ECF subfamily